MWVINLFAKYENNLNVHIMSLTVQREQLKNQCFSPFVLA